MKLKIKKLSPSAEIPTRGSDGAAGWDFYASRVEPYGSTQLLAHTDIAVELPEGCAGLLFPRSSVVNTGVRLANCVGVIDSDYRGEVTAVFDVLNKWHERNYRAGDRVFQMVIVKVEEFDGVEVCERLSKTERGERGYGSTGR